jgi:hypothetical protein
MIGAMRRLAIAVVASALVASIGASAASALVTRQKLASFDGSHGMALPVLAAAADNSAASPNSGDVLVGLGSGVVLGFDEVGNFTGLKITGAKTPAGEFSLESGSLTSGIAVDSASGEGEGDIYVADIKNEVVDKFDPRGHYLCQITGSSTPSASECDREGSETFAGSMDPRGLAVDSQGDLYVSDVAHDAIDEFSPTGEFMNEFADPAPDPGALAVNGSGDVYVANGETSLPGGVVELSPSGLVIPRPELEATDALSVTIDPRNGDVLVSEPPPFGIKEFSASGGLVTSFGVGGSELAITSESNGRLYADAGTGPAITIYSPLETIPEVSTGVATGVAPESATFHGEVTPDPHEETTECVFEYGPTTSYGKRAPCEPLSDPGYTETTSVSATVDGLTPGTTYHFSVRAGDERGKTNGLDETLTTPPLVPVVPAVSGEAANPSVSQATVRAQIAPNGSSASCHVQYVEEAQFKLSGYAAAASAPCSGPSLGEGYAAKRAQAQLSGLHASAVYHYRFVATNATGTSIGEDATLATFGLQTFSAQVLNKEGQPYTQAGGHPYKLVTNFEFNIGSDSKGHRATDANPRNIVTELPPGYIGNVGAIPKCTDTELVRDTCGPDAQVGVIHLRLDSEREEFPEPLYNVVPPAGYPAALGFRIKTFVSVFILFSVRTGGDYGVTAEALDSSTNAGLEGATIEVWGVPGDPSHDGERECAKPETFEKEVGCSIEAPQVPFLTNPTSCTPGPQTETLRADSWQEPGDYVTAKTTLPEITGCSAVPFSPKASVQPTTSDADSPTGLTTTIEVPQSEGPKGIAQSDLKQTEVKLPQGMIASPSGANGLQACSQEQFRLGDASEPSCPGASRIGTVEIVTPLLSNTVEGSLYLAQQNANPFNSTLAIYLYAQADGAVIKLAGHVSSDPTTGQLTATFSETPQLPFKSLRVVLEPGPRASLATPESCGVFSTDIGLTPWSALPAAAPLELASPLEVSSDCVGGFAPSFSAGSASSQAGAYTPLQISFSRSDEEQELSGLTTNLPVGLTAKIAGVPQCPEAAAAAGTCPESSEVGTVESYAGPGPDPIALPGVAYLTGPYRGAPYGLAVVVPAIAGPFDLGKVVVRAALYVNENNAHVTAVSDPFPTILDVTGADGGTDGFPVRLRRVDISIDRPDFTVNPTNCDPLAITASFLSTTGTSASTSAPFQAGNCATLKFAPKFQASINGHASKADGVQLTTKLTFPATTLGSEANVAKAKVTLPIQIPSEQHTLEKACLAAVFEKERAHCPPQSLVGHAVAHTPLLAEPLTGPAYLVSHGGEAFPSLITVLHGDNITFDLVATTLIRHGITSSTFDSVPDDPITSFELTFPSGPYSLLGAFLPETARYNFCGRPTLYMPTTFIGQNGIEVSARTPISLTGCTAVKHRRAASTPCRKRKSGSKRSSSCAAATRRRPRHGA